jgi:dimethylamine monooxygenase subunit A
MKLRPLAEAAAALHGFPFPFDDATYMYSTNVEPAERPRTTTVGEWGRAIYDVDAHYLGEIAERERILEHDPSRCQVLPHMREAAWDVVEHVTRKLAQEYPSQFALSRDGDHFRWVNRPLEIEQRFTRGDDDTLPMEPFEWIARQVQEDIELLDQRGENLYLDAGILTFGADWSLDFDLGMSFLEIHGPVPRVHELGVIPRAHKFLLGLQPGPAFRRTNWTLTIDRRLDTTTEVYPIWGPDRASLEFREIGPRVHLRVEVQHFVRLARSNAVMFPIRTYLAPFDAIAAVPIWSARLQSVLATLPQDLVDYKGLTRFRDDCVAWLAQENGDAARAARYGGGV